MDAISSIQISSQHLRFIKEPTPGEKSPWSLDWRRMSNQHLLQATNTRGTTQCPLPENGCYRCNLSSDYSPSCMLIVGKTSPTDGKAGDRVGEFCLQQWCLQSWLNEDNMEGACSWEPLKEQNWRTTVSKGALLGRLTGYGSGKPTVGASPWRGRESCSCSVPNTGSLSSPILIWGLENSWRAADLQSMEIGLGPKIGGETTATE